jgi:hypothetical protein
VVRQKVRLSEFIVNEPWTQVTYQPF